MLESEILVVKMTGKEIDLEAVWSWEQRDVGINLWPIISAEQNRLTKAYR